MVVSYSLGRKSLAAHRDELAAIASQLDTARGVMLALADEDAEAYATLSSLWKLPADDPGRTGAFQAAVRRAIMVPRTVAAAAVDLLRACERLLPISNPNLRSDLIAAAVLAETAAVAAGLNVRVNAPQLEDPAEHERVLRDLEGVLADAASRRNSLASQLGC
jgi:formiminotetrahydrofolate cyclodeaminase